jgi:hypothetical protein
MLDFHAGYLLARMFHESLAATALHETSGLGTEISWYCIFFTIEAISQLADTTILARIIREISGPG